MQESHDVQEKQKCQSIQFPAAETKSPDITVMKLSTKQKMKLQLLPKNIKEKLESKMHWLIISILYETTENYHETKEHLNLLKKRLLKHFENLEIPMNELNSLENVQKILHEEKQRSIFIQEGLEHLEEEIVKVLPVVNTRYEKIQSLEKKIEMLKHELASEEAAASKLFQRDYSDDLALPHLSVEHLNLPVLQNEILKTGNQQGLLHDMNIIQLSDEMKIMKSLQEQMYENMEF